MNTQDNYEAEETQEINIQKDYRRVNHEEFELQYAVKMRREEILSDSDKSRATPILVDNVFYSKKEEIYENKWNNLIINGDNLQFLKTLYANKDPLIKDKIKGKIKLIYIDPPFGTQKNFGAYIDKKNGSDYIEFIRKRLIVAYELLSDDGFLLLHIDYRYKFLLKMVLDEIFHFNFVNEIIIKRNKKNDNIDKQARKLNESFDTIFLYSKTRYTKFNSPKKEKEIKGRWVSLQKKSENRLNVGYELLGVTPKIGRRWIWKKERIEEASKRYNDIKKQFNNNEDLENHLEQMTEKVDLVKINENGTLYYYIFSSNEMLCDNIWDDLLALDLSSKTLYPHKKNEKLLERVINMCSSEGDIVLDYFGGSGTTAAVAEKLNRKWITCDIGKISNFTTIKRLLQINQNKMEIEGFQPIPIVTCKTDLYDTEKILDLNWEQYKHFVSGLFKFHLKNVEVMNVFFEGKKDGNPVKIFNYKVGGALTQENVQIMHNYLKKSSLTKVYIVVPNRYIGFFEDELQFNKITYIFLKIPSKSFNNDGPWLENLGKGNEFERIEKVTGFRFIDHPKIQYNSKQKDDFFVLEISKFIASGDSDFTKLSSIFVNYDFDGNNFLIDHFLLMEEVKYPNHAKSGENINYETDVPWTDKIHIKISWIDKRIIKMVFTVKNSESFDKTAFIFSDIRGNETMITVERDVKDVSK